MHPDRNYGHVEAATQQFADVQSAYEVLSDPQERAWYDAHRENILYGDEDGEGNFENNIRSTTSDEVLRFISKVDFHMSPTASSTSVFTTVDEFFNGLAKEEEAASAWSGLETIQYPPFGKLDDSHADVVRPFYAMWSGFATAKSYSWKDVYRYSEAPDRKVRRMMEKENKRFRDDAIREFNDAVRSLVAFIRKRDPRAKPNKQSEADRQKVLRDAVVAQAARSRAANEAKLVDTAVPDWMSPTTTDAMTISDDEKAGSDVSRHEVHCVVCNKTFKSEKQYEAHERSRKHIKSVQQLRRQMLRENRALNLNDAEKVHDSSDNEAIFKVNQLELDEQRTSLEHINLECSHHKRPESVIKSEDGESNSSVLPTGRADPIVFEPDRSLDEDYFSNEVIGKTIFDKDVSLGSERATEELSDISSDRDLLEHPVDASVSDDIDTKKEPKIGKAKEKRAKKAAQKSSQAVELDGDFSCTNCEQVFTSKNQLFKHIKYAGHAHSTEKKRQGK